jgi:large repetitive protein
MQLTRRRLITTLGALSATGLLAACGPSTPVPPPAPAPSVAPTAPPAIAPVATVPPATVAAATAPTATAVPSTLEPVAKPPVTPTAAPSAQVVAGKQMYQQNAQHTGRSPYAGPTQARVLRRFDTAAAENMPPDPVTPRADFQSSSVVGPDGTIYIANFPGVLFALRDSPNAGDRLDAVWKFHPPSASSLHATPALSSDGKAVYLGFSAGGFSSPGQATLYALKTASNGPEPQVLWSVDMGATRVMASPTVGQDGAIYVTTSAGELFSIGPDGKVRWTAQTGPTIKSASAIGLDGTVYNPTSDGKMYAVSPQGQVKWSFDFGQHLGPTPLVVSPTPGPGGGGGGSAGIGSGASPTVAPDGTIFIGANNSNMYAVAPDGSLKWLFEAERELAGIWTTPVLSSDASTIWFGANKGGVYALNTRDGSKRWQFPVYGSIYASSVVDSRGVLYTGTTIEHLYAIDSSNGEPLWDLDVHNQVWSAPSIRPDGTLVIADRGGVVQVIG